MFTKDMYRCYVTSSKSLFVTFILQGSAIPIVRYFLRNPYCVWKVWNLYSLLGCLD